jgi:hypothetical protein
MLANKKILYEMVSLSSKMGRFIKLRKMCTTIKRSIKNLLMESTLAKRSDRQIRLAYNDLSYPEILKSCSRRHLVSV